MSPIFETDPKVLKEKKEKVQEEQKPRKKLAREPLQQLQQKVGNQTVQRMVVQRSGEGGSNLDEETTRRIQTERSGGEALDGDVQASMSQSFKQDFDGVRVHTSAESDALNRELGAKAFTTGKDIFFRSGAYDPASKGGQQLIAHELTHVVQQSGSASQPDTAFRVHPAGDAYEQEADAAARQVVEIGAAAPAGGVQMQEEEEEEENLVQMQSEEEEKILSAATAKSTKLDETAAGMGNELPEEMTAKEPGLEETMPGVGEELPEKEESTEKGKLPEEEEFPS